jgi:hypothetical protein
MSSVPAQIRPAHVTKSAGENVTQFTAWPVAGHQPATGARFCAKLRAKDRVALPRQRVKQPANQA